ncbi:helix-turn-helix domain-containing protein [Paracoccus cavernae]|uniref:helix-turn-helix domain-containing protein n=1 Tax=Paracoccus cavernae TaxID=1571207 RepID=UPI0035F4F323
MKLLTEPEVAELLRCSTTKIKRLRLSGALAYYVGRPTLIAETDLLAYLETIRRNAEPPPPPTSEQKARADLQSAREWAIKAKLKRSWGTKRGSGPKK